jgi:heptosyltransferase-3
MPVIEVGLNPSIACEDGGFVSLCGRLSIAETAEVIRRAAFFIGVDSAGAHMANVWRIPSLLLFGHYKGQRAWTPYEGFFGEDPDRWILRHDGPLAGQSAEQVIERLDRIARVVDRVETLRQGPPDPA